MKKLPLLQHGFHFIEILMVLAVVSLLAAFSLPLYTQYMTNERRLEAASLLSQLAIAMEAYHIQHNTYQQATLAALQFPEWTTKKTYRLMIQTTTDNDYLLVATPLGQQAERDKACNVLTLNAVGKKGVMGPKRWDECW